MIARVATATERVELWPQVIAVFPHYGDYRYHGTDETPLVILEPAGPTQDR